MGAISVNLTPHHTQCNHDTVYPTARCTVRPLYIGVCRQTGTLCTRDRIHRSWNFAGRRDRAMAISLCRNCLVSRSRAKSKRRCGRGGPSVARGWTKMGERGEGEGGGRRVHIARDHIGPLVHTERGSIINSSGTLDNESRDSVIDCGTRRTE